MFCITYFIVIEFTKKTTINTTKHVAKLLFNISFKRKITTSKTYNHSIFNSSKPLIKIIYN